MKTKEQKSSYKNYIEIANKFIDEHNSNGKWSPFDRIEIVSIMLYAQYLEDIEHKSKDGGDGLISADAE
jgi:hypothetical protein